MCNCVTCSAYFFARRDAWARLQAARKALHQAPASTSAQAAYGDAVRAYQGVCSAQRVRHFFCAVRHSRASRRVLTPRGGG